MNLIGDALVRHRLAVDLDVDCGRFPQRVVHCAVGDDACNGFTIPVGKPAGRITRSWIDAMRAGGRSALRYSAWTARPARIRP